AAAILAQLLRRRGIGAQSLTSEDVAPSKLPQLDMAGVRIIVLSYMNQDSTTHAKYLVRRLRRRAAATSIMLGFWSLTSEALIQRKVLDETRADLVTLSLRDAIKQITSATTEKGEK
ncbi:MAG: hypothetical protein NTU78_04040, partial [Alphaproteobacteria bacterium]|nr:hypothetical protein [Alphaproteobacteria bacterium]